MLRTSIMSRRDANHFLANSTYGQVPKMNLKRLVRFIIVSKYIMQILYKTSLNVAKIHAGYQHNCPRVTINQKLTKSLLKTESNNKVFHKSLVMNLNAIMNV
jgi:hypothetical protein